MLPVLRRILYAAASVAAAFGILWLIDHQAFRRRTAETDDRPFEPVSQPRLEPGQTSLSAALSAERVLMVERVMPAVVSINVERRRTETDQIRTPSGTREATTTVPEPSVGSGAFVSERGHIITNWHVVEGGENSIFVTVSGEESARRATLVDKDDQIDIALLKVELRRPGETFTALRFGDSDKVKQGEEVLAMGSPFNLRETVTNGIISHRQRRLSDTLTAYLQVTCIINPGNSGGPLVNLQGDIVGIVTRKLQGPDERAPAEGYGLAIPGNDALEALDRLSGKGRPRVYLGLTVDDWPRDNWQKSKPPEAVIVTGVAGESPAARAGLQPGDVIEAVNGARVTSFSEYRRATRSGRVGEEVTFTARREGEVRQFKAVLADFDKAVPPESAVKPASVFGITVRVLRRNERNLLGLYEAVGLAVEEVAEDSPFAGIVTPGTNIVNVATTDRVTISTIATPGEFRTVLNSLKSTGGIFYVPVPGESGFRYIAFPPFR